jgi:hypothetical protein
LGLKGSLPRNCSDGIQRVPSIFVPRNRIPVIFSSVEDSERNSESSFYFCSREWNSELFSLPRKGSERNSESFLFRGTAGIPSEIPICSGYSVFRGIFFCWKFPTLVLSPPDILLESCGLFSEWLLILYPMKLSNSF